VTATLAGARPGVAAPPAPAPLSLLISPAWIDADADGPGVLPTIVLTNRSDVSFRVKVIPAIAAQALEGGLLLRRGARSDALARRILRVTGPRTIGPHASIDIHASFLSFAGRSSMTLAAAITATPLHPPPGAIKFRFTFLAAIFIHRPHVAPASPLILSVRVKRVKRRIELTAQVRNRGLKPAFITSVKFRVKDAGHRTLASASGPTGYVVPRSARNFRTQLFHKLPPGKLQAEAIVRYGTRETRRSGFFRV
jgi:hypothetical protein